MKKAMYEFTPDGKVAFRLVYHKVNSKRMNNLTPKDKETLRDIVSRFESILSELKKEIQ